MTADNSGRAGRKITNSRPPTKRTHPYENFEGTPMWKAVDRAIKALLRNRDIQLTTHREYVVGYICKQINSRGKINSPGK